ncbi:hypothetical protein L6164_033148 [Bauhinia variegata]|uniref:Uncharacterized protein n=1 Tax=Bauhinia variegata TaxID=167791 RepID=A0ACB9KR04_BAUVA|nr:hypothetical protein L6164_033148 [Bauhinia variegata]
MSLEGPCSIFGDELRTSAQEQVQLMVMEDTKLDHVMWVLKVKLIEITGKLSLGRNEPLLNSKANEGITVSLVLTLPFNDQADTLADWIRSDKVQYPHFVPFLLVKFCSWLCKIMVLMFEFYHGILIIIGNFVRSVFLRSMSFHLM